MPMSEPHVRNLDWPSTVAELRRRVASHLRGWDVADIEDCSQDAALRVVRVVEREGWPRNPGGLYTVVARRAAIDFIRARRARPAHVSLEDEVEGGPGAAPGKLPADLHDEIQAKAFLVLHYFRRHNVHCEPLARARAEGLDLKTFAEQSGQSHAAVLQRWSRCVRRLFEDIQRGLFHWPWPYDLSPRRQ